MVNAKDANADAGGCYEKNFLPAKKGQARKPWTQDVNETDVLKKVEWGSCDKCEYHMGDEQWDVLCEINTVEQT